MQPASLAGPRADRRLPSCPPRRVAWTCGGARERRAPSACWALAGLRTAMSPQVGPDWTRSARLTAVELTDPSQVHPRQPGPCQGMAKPPAVGRPSAAPFQAPPPPPATPTFFLCCESSKGCRRRVRRSQALEDGPQLLFRLQDVLRGWSSALPSGCGGPPGLPRPPLPPAAGGGGAATEGLSREQWRQDSRVLPHGHHMSPTAQPPHLLLGVRASSPPPDAFLQALLERIQTGKEERRDPRINTPVAPSLTAPHPSPPRRAPAQPLLPTLFNQDSGGRMVT